jgi:GTP cyclohydrolase I
MKKLSNTCATFAKRVLVGKMHSKYILKWFMKTKSNSNVIYVIIQLSHMCRLEDTLNASMKNSNSTNVVFVTRTFS